MAAAKLAITIIVIALTASSVLAVRQQRLMAHAEMTAALRQARALDRQLLAHRARIAQLTAPHHIARLAPRLAPLKPAPPDWRTLNHPYPQSQRDSPRPPTPN